MTITQTEVKTLRERYRLPSVMGRCTFQRMKLNAHAEWIRSCWRLVRLKADEFYFAEISHIVHIHIELEEKK